MPNTIHDLHLNQSGIMISNDGLRLRYGPHPSTPCPLGHEYCANMNAPCASLFGVIDGHILCDAPVSDATNSSPKSEEYEGPDPDKGVDDRWSTDGDEVYNDSDLAALWEEV